MADDSIVHDYCLPQIGPLDCIAKAGIHSSGLLVESRSRNVVTRNEMSRTKVAPDAQVMRTGNGWRRPADAAAGRCSAAAGWHLSIASSPMVPRRSSSLVGGLSRLSHPEHRQNKTDSPPEPQQSFSMRQTEIMRWQT